MAIALFFPLLCTAADAPPFLLQDGAANRIAAFNEVWNTVNDTYFDRSFGGVDWASVKIRYLARLPQVKSAPDLRSLLSEMLGELKCSHFAVIAREASVFQVEERVRVGTTGFDVAYVEDRVVIARQQFVGPSQLHGGDVITAVDGYSIEQFRRALEQTNYPKLRFGLLLTEFVRARLRGPVGTVVQLTKETGDGGRTPVSVTCVPHRGNWSDPIGYFPSEPLDIETGWLADGVGYLRFNVFAPALMKEVRRFIKLPSLKALVIDLRGNKGGLTPMVSGIAGLLVEQEISIGKILLRDGSIALDAYPQTGAFTGPVAVLIDCCSASSSEILAAALQENGRARVIGEVSAGAALPSLFRSLATGDLFQYAIADVRTPNGHSIEGRGVIPDEIVAPRRDDLVKGQDCAANAALAWFRQQTTTPMGGAIP